MFRIVAAAITRDGNEVSILPQENFETEEETVAAIARMVQSPDHSGLTFGNIEIVPIVPQPEPEPMAPIEVSAKAKRPRRSWAKKEV